MNLKKTKNSFIKPNGHLNSTQNPTDLVSGVKFHLQIQVQMSNSILFQMIQTDPRGSPPPHLWTVELPAKRRTYDGDTCRRDMGWAGEARPGRHDRQGRSSLWAWMVKWACLGMASCVCVTAIAYPNRLARCAGYFGPLSLSNKQNGVDNIASVSLPVLEQRICEGMAACRNTLQTSNKQKSDNHKRGKFWRGVDNLVGEIRPFATYCMCQSSN
jgi:hypothetical protein